jgi:hypothetical protein
MPAGYHLARKVKVVTDSQEFLLSGDPDTRPIAIRPFGMFSESSALLSGGDHEPNPKC